MHEWLDPPCNIVVKWSNLFNFLFLFCAFDRRSKSTLSVLVLLVLVDWLQAKI